MPLSVGAHLGPYEILTAIGAGGMGEVYRARDARLGRDVAMKVLPADVANDPTRLHRFEHEARAAAALNHSNILAVYDIGKDGGITYMVTELLDGRTLRETQNAERLTVPRVIDLAAQIADGLAAAHGRNIVHRDIKPENVFVTSDGRAKILDFGLAKTIESDAAAVEAPTRSATAPHTVLGTAGYMAPEQVRGQPLDHRADIFAFGAVLYEMLTGRRAFSGETALDTMSAILREVPAAITASPDRPIPPLLLRVVDRCLEKSPAARFQSTTDLAFALKSLSRSDSSTTVSPDAALVPRAARSARWRRALPWAVAALAVLAGALAWVTAPKADGAATREVVSFTLHPPSGKEFGFAQVAPHPAISPDGRQLVFQLGRGSGDASGSLWLRPIEAIDARPLVVTGDQPFWSADGRFIGFWDAGRLKRLDPVSGTVQTITELTNLAGAAWAPDGTIVVGGNGPLLRVPAGGGALTPLTILDEKAKHSDHRNPFFLPGGRRFLYQSTPDNGIWIGSLDGGPSKFLREADSKAQYAAGWLLFVNEMTLFAQRFDTDRLALAGEPRVLAEDVRTNERNRRAAFTVSESVLVYRTGDQGRDRTLVWLDRSNKEVGTVPDSVRRYQFLTLPPDNRRASAVIVDGLPGAEDLWRIELDSGRQQKLTTDPHSDHYPVISPDGEWVAWRSDRITPGQIFKKPLRAGAADADTPWIKCDGDAPALPSDWSKNWLVFYCGNRPPGTLDIWVVPIDDPARRRPYLASNANELFGRLSPDEKWMVYQADMGAPGQFGVYVSPFPDAAGRTLQVSGTEGGLDPVWRNNGQEIFYVGAGARDVMAVSFKHGKNGPEPGSPRLVWQHPSPLNRRIAITADGQRALLARPLQTTDTETPLTVIVNWTRLLAAK